MKELPKSDDALLLRTDFTDDAAWEAVSRAVQVPSDEGFRAYLACISDPCYDGLTVDQLVGLASQGVDDTFAFLVDRLTLTDAEHPVLVVDLIDQPGRTFRVVPAQVHSVENNLSLANMDYEDFADSLDLDGVFRGFPEP